MTVYDGDKQDGWNEYLLYGGLPPVVLQKTEEEKVRRMLEVDFVCNQGYKRCYIQSALSLPDKEKTKQELASLLRIDDSFMKYVITGDLIKKYQNDDGIVFMDVFDFLQDKESI